MFELRPFQREALTALQSEAHVICVAATGSGKSLIYERTAALPGFKTLLVTPLVALARQQQRRLEASGVQAFLGAGTPKDSSPRPGETGAWIVSPETLRFEKRRRELSQWKPNFLVVDECHCLWDWGDRFRPAFSSLPSLIREFSIPRSLWLTATLPNEARRSLLSQLPQPTRELGEFALPASLHLEVARVPWAYRADAMVEWLSRRPEPGILFVPTRSNTERLARLLASHGRKVLGYHAGMSSEERKLIESAIERRECDVVVATSAFGMGMDHSHLRWVVLWQAPYSLLSLTQAIGRAGRCAAANSYALVMWDEDDFRLLEWTVQNSERRKDELRYTREFLETMQCRERGLSRYFNPLVKQNYCNRCDFCASSQIAI